MRVTIGGVVMPRAAAVVWASGGAPRSGPSALDVDCLEDAARELSGPAVSSLRRLGKMDEVELLLGLPADCGLSGSSGGGSLVLLESRKGVILLPLAMVADSKKGRDGGQDQVACLDQTK